MKIHGSSDSYNQYELNKPDNRMRDNSYLSTRDEMLTNQDSENNRLELKRVNPPVIAGKEKEAAKIDEEMFSTIMMVEYWHAPKALAAVDAAWSKTLKSVLFERPDLAKKDFDFYVDKKELNVEGKLRVKGDSLSEAERMWLENKLNADKSLVSTANQYTDTLLSMYDKYRQLGQLMDNKGSVDKANRIYGQALDGMGNIAFRDMLNRAHDYQMQAFGYLHTEGRKPQAFGTRQAGTRVLDSQPMYRPAQSLANKYLNVEEILGDNVGYWFQERTTTNIPGFRSDDR